MSRQRRPRLVAGYDGSPASRAAVALAADRAGSTGMVTVVHAYKPPRNVSDPLGLARRRADRRDQAQAVLDELLLIGDDELLETEYETELVEGEAASAIDAVARRVDADEIVVGARGRGRLPGLLGSVSHQLLAIADRPVLVVPARAVKSRPRRQPV